MPDDLANAYEARRPLLEHVAHQLECEVREYLASVPRVEQISFCIQDVRRFVEAAQQAKDNGHVVDPLVEIDDQIAGRVVVSCDLDLVVVEQQLRSAFSTIDSKWQDASLSEKGTQPTHSIVCLIPPQVKPPGWDARNDVPNVFQLHTCIDPTLLSKHVNVADGAMQESQCLRLASASRPVSGQVLFGLHGIRTHAEWCRVLYEVAPQYGWQVRMDRWNFGRYSLFRFLHPWSRSDKVRWFREVYEQEVRDKDVGLGENQYPSIVAHSFGTYILGNALLKYDWLRFDKIILCGSILPQDFPWTKLIERGQVQAVRNEYGTNDVPTRFVRWFVAGTGPSGREGFEQTSERFEEERFEYTHSEYFDKGHMKAKWLPFLDRQFPFLSASGISIERPKASRPWGLYAVYALLVAVAFLFAAWYGLFGRLIDMYTNAPCPSGTICSATHWKYQIAIPNKQSDPIVTPLMDIKDCT